MCIEINVIMGIIVTEQDTIERTENFTFSNLSFIVDFIINHNTRILRINTKYFTFINYNNKLNRVPPTKTNIDIIHEIFSFSEYSLLNGLWNS